MKPLFIKSTMKDSISPSRVICEEHAPAYSITARHKPSFCAQLQKGSDQHPNPLCCDANPKMCISVCARMTFARLNSAMTQQAESSSCRHQQLGETANFTDSRNELTRANSVFIDKTYTIIQLTRDS